MLLTKNKPMPRHPTLSFLLFPLALSLSACGDSSRTAATDTSEDILKEAVPVDTRQQAELQKETEALKAKREADKAELEKLRKEAASLSERLEALNKGDLAKASSGNTDEASASRPSPPPPTVVSATTANAAKAQLEVQLITMNLKELCDLALTKMDLTGKTSLTFDDLVGPGKPIPAIKSHAGEIYAGLVFTPQKTAYEVTTIDGRTIRYERSK